MQFTLTRQRRIVNINRNVKSALFCHQFELAEGDAHINLLYIPSIRGDITLAALFIKMCFVTANNNAPGLFIDCGRSEPHGFKDICKPSCCFLFLLKQVAVSPQSGNEETNMNKEIEINQTDLNKADAAGSEVRTCRSAGVSQEAVRTFGNPHSDTFLIQMVDDHDLEVIDKEVALTAELSGGQDFCLKAVKAGCWNDDLSPWPAPAVFGDEDFGDGAAATLEYVLENIVPTAEERESKGIRRVFIGGYSLAGLFALWAGYQTDRFDGIAAASPSIWFPGFTEYMQNNEIHADAVYLSLGDREEKTRNPVMSRVGDAIREAVAILNESGRDCVLEWNKGNHFKNTDLRTAKAFAWLMNRS